MRYNPMTDYLKKQHRCGAKVKSRKGATCQQVAMANGRCYWHGGKSTGPRTKEGLLRMKQSKIKHGFYTKEQINDRKAFRSQLQQAKDELNGILDTL